jgi:hypothetical protein
VQTIRLPLLTGLATLSLLIATEPGLSIVWDEGYTLGRIERVRLWFSAMANPAGFAETWAPPSTELVQQQGLAPPNKAQVGSRLDLLFNPRVIGWFWPFAREEPHGHPPFYAMVGLIGDLFMPWREPLARARLGTMLFHAIACAFTFYVFDKRLGRKPAAVSSLLLAASPHLFALGHYATYDGLLNSLWIIALLATSESISGDSKKIARLYQVVTGLTLGAAMATKLSGWFLLFPISFGFLLGGISRRNIRGYCLTLLTAVISVYFWNPSWWCEPVAGPLRFFQSNLNRAATIPIETLYLGKVYKTPAESLPWSNTIVWSILATPALGLLLLIPGFLSLFKPQNNRNLGLIILSGWAIPMLLRAMPHTPGHDGTRQLINAIGTSCLLAGLGMEWIGRSFKKIATLLPYLLAVELALSLAIFYPVPLAYFSPLVGSLPGAQKLGMEPVYYWDAFTPEALTWINVHSEAQDKIAFVGTPTSFLYLNQVDRLKPAVDPRTPGKLRWLVMQNRPGNFQERDWAVVRTLKPAYTYSKLGVWLVAVYDMNEVQQLWNSLPPNNRP